MRGINNEIIRYFISRRNVVGVGLSVKKKQNRERKCLVIFVEKKSEEEQCSLKEIIPHEIGDYAVDVIEVGELKLMRRAMLRPAPPGCSIGHYRISAGTLGAVVKDRISQEDLILSNNHVLANSTNGKDGKAKIGDFILQPGVHDGGKIPQHVLARLWRFVPIHQEKSPSGCFLLRGIKNCLRTIKCQLPSFKGGKACFPEENLVDAAVAMPISSSSLNPSILGLGRVNGVAEAQVGRPIYFSGRTSGVQKGNVLAVGSTFRVKVGYNSYAIFSDQIVTSGISQPGDSGALAINEKKEAVGLLFAGSKEATIYNRIQNVLQHLDVILA